jgi:hypothetical protein
LVFFDRLFNLDLSELEDINGKSRVDVQPEMGGGAFFSHPFSASGLKNSRDSREPTSNRFLPIIPIRQAFQTVRSRIDDVRSCLSVLPSAVRYLSSRSIRGIFIFTGQAS